LRIDFVSLARHARQQPNAAFFPVLTFVGGAMARGRKTAIEKLIPTAVAHHASDLGSFHIGRFSVSLFRKRLALIRFLQSPMLSDPIARDASASTPHTFVADREIG